MLKELSCLNAKPTLMPLYLHSLISFWRKIGHAFCIIRMALLRENEVVVFLRMLIGQLNVDRPTKTTPFVH